MEGLQLRCAPEPQARASTPAAILKLRVKAIVTAVKLINEFQLVPHRRLWENVLDGHQLAPAGMADHQIRLEALLLQSHGLSGDRLSTQTFGLKITGPGMNGLGRRGLGQGVAVQGDVGQAWGLWSSNRPAAMAHGLQPRRQVAELTREVLVNEKNRPSHRR